MSGIRDVVRSGVGNLSVARARRELTELSAAGGQAATLAAVLGSSIGGEGGPNDRQTWFVKIEALRSELEEDLTLLEIVDFGSGSSGDERTERQMHDGVIVQRTVKAQCSANKPAYWTAILHDLVYAYKPSFGVELGTCLGMSASYQGAAMERANHGNFITLEGAEALALMSRENLASLGLSRRVEVIQGRFSDTLPEVLRLDRPIDYAFIDGHHEEQATIDYFEQILPRAAANGLLVFDDINWTDGMVRAWEYVVAHAAVTVAVDLGAIGVCVVNATNTPRVNVRLPLRGL